MVLIFSFQTVRATCLGGDKHVDYGASSLLALFRPDSLGFLHNRHPIMHENRCGFCSDKAFELHSSSVKAGKSAM